MPLSLPSQRTWVVGDVVTAAMMNSNVRDAVNFLLNPPIADVYQSAAQTLATGTATDVTFDASNVDTYAGHSNSVNNSRYVAQVAGWYLVVAEVGFTGNANGRRSLAIQKNDVDLTPIRQSKSADPSNIGLVLQAAAVTQLAVSDYVDVSAFQNSTVSLALLMASMTVLWVHA